MVVAQLQLQLQLRIQIQIDTYIRTYYTRERCTTYIRMCG